MTLFLIFASFLLAFIPIVTYVHRRDVKAQKQHHTERLVQWRNHNDKQNAQRAIKQECQRIVMEYKKLS